ncbi:hypothetical protein A3Q56_02198 [Intoshia linei]|uniref:26S proteasome non-ATPase regulatory subunit 4 n=1 Tax=Intoshia linei TaxID=1819745 RepID=A0A177B8P9_9BILA|nr:hypothetical protein A3Q56_02198 [Intoshia linei]
MVIEYVVFCLDTSDYLRNGDFIPNRMIAQIDASIMFCETIMNGNPESKVGLMTMKPKVLMTLTNNVHLITSYIDMLKISEDKQNFDKSIRTAHLVLKNSLPENNKTRIVAFVASPLENTDLELSNLASCLRSENIQVDVVNFGEDESNKLKFERFIQILNGRKGKGSTLVNVPRGSVLINELQKSAMINSDGPGNFEFGVDPSVDPELAMALKMSMQDQKRTSKSGASEGKNTHVPDKSTLPSKISNSQKTGNNELESVDFKEMSEDEQLKYALELSLKESNTQKPEPMKIDYDCADSLIKNLTVTTSDKKDNLTDKKTDDSDTMDLD